MNLFISTGIVHVWFYLPLSVMYNNTVCECVYVCIYSNWTSLFSNVEKLPCTVSLRVKKENPQDPVIPLTLVSVTTVHG